MTREFATLAEAAAGVPERVALHLALPCQEALLERLTLPATDRDELAGMTQLQLEKTLPYPVEEVTSGMEIVGTAGEESTVITLAVHTPGLAELCRPLREAGHTPQRISLFAQAVAGRAPAGERVLMIWPEQGQTVLAIVEDRKLSWAQVIAGAEDAAAAEMPAFLLGAEMNGVPVDFARALLASVNAAVTADLQAVLDCPVEPFSPAEISTEGNIDFLPPSWSAEAHRSERIEKLKQRLLMAAVVYLLLVACAFLYLAWTKRQLQAVEVQLARLQPLVETTRARQHALGDARAGAGLAPLHRSRRWRWRTKAGRRTMCASTSSTARRDSSWWKAKRLPRSSRSTLPSGCVPSPS